MKIPDGMEKYINDYKIQIFEVAWLTEEEIERFQSDFRIVANFFTQKRKNKDYIPDDPTEIKYVDEVLKLLNVMTGDKRYEKIFQKKTVSSYPAVAVQSQKGIYGKRSKGNYRNFVICRLFFSFTSLQKGYNI